MSGITLLIEDPKWRSHRGLTARLTKAAQAARRSARLKGAFTVLLANDKKLRALNYGFRGKDKPTNVLSFPAFPFVMGGPLPPMLGDIVLAAETVGREAALEDKPLENHITHLVIHGLLHLLGYDHETDAEAEEMEAVERRALARLAIPDPYA